MFDAGIDSPLGDLLGSVRSVVAGVEVDRLDPPTAARVVEDCAEAEKVLAALRVAATATLQNNGLPP